MTNGKHIRNVQMIGNAGLMGLPKTAFLSSRKVAPAAVMRCYDWATGMRGSGSAGRLALSCVVGGFQSALERDVLKLLRPEIESESFQPFWTDSTGPHTIYTVLAHPTAPWEAAHSATQRPWASALDFACLTAKGARSANAALTAITQKLFSGMGFEYDTMWGTTQYYDSEEKSFKLSEYLSDEGGVVNCYDQALGVVSLGNVLGTESHVVAVVPLGYVEVGELVGVGRCNNPLYTGPERWRRRCRIEGEVTTRVVYVPRSPMASEDTIDRSMFDSHGFVVSDGLVFDACVGPFCGELDATNYLNQVVDQTTEDERLNGFFAPDRGGRIINESPVFKMR